MIKIALGKKIAFFLLISICLFIQVNSVFAIQTQSLSDVSWEDLPTYISELTTYSLEIDFDFSDSSLINYTIETQDVTINNVENPVGCIINQNNITCPSSLEPTINITTNTIDQDTTIYWQVHTNDAVDGKEIWTLSYPITDIYNAPQISNLSYQNFSLIPPHTQLNINFTYTEENFSLSNATLNYNISINHSTQLTPQNTNSLIFDCNTTNKICQITINTTELMNLTNQEYFFNSFIQVYDAAGNQHNNTQVNFFIDSIEPTVETNYPNNNTKTNNESVTFTAAISDNTLEILNDYTPEFNCTFYFNNFVIGFNTTSTNLISYTHNLSSYSENSYNWSFTCSDLGENFNTSNSAILTTDLTAPNVTNQSTNSISSSSFTVEAESNEVSIISIYYSTNFSLINESYQNASFKSSTTYSANSSISLTSLSSSTTYYYKIELCDEADNCKITDEIYNQTTAQVTSSSSSSSSGRGGSRSHRSQSTDDLEETETITPESEVSLNIEENSNNYENEISNSELEINNLNSLIETHGTVEEPNLEEKNEDYQGFLTGAASYFKAPIFFKGFYNISLIIFALLLMVLLYIHIKQYNSLTPVKFNNKSSSKKIKNTSKHKHIEIDTSKFGNWFELANSNKELKNKVKKTK